MMTVRLLITVSLIIFCLQSIASVSYAESARVLPKGISKARLVTTQWLTWEERYNERGDIENIGNNYNRTLNSTIFPRLGLVETGFGLPAGSANIGKSQVDLEMSASISNFVFAHGITDRLTGAINIPYWTGKNKVRADLDTTNATVGKSAIGAGFGAPIVPLAGGGPFGDAVPFISDDVQALLQGGLDVDGNGTIDVPGFGYRRFRTSWDEGIGDMEAYLKYQYLKTENWRLAATAGARFPTGEIDDPDNLNDILPFTSGAYAILGRLSNDYMGIKNHLFNLTFKYDLILSDSEELRILRDANNPLTVDKEKVDRDIGDIMRINVSDTYTPFKGLSLIAEYQFTNHKKDRVSGDLGHLTDPVTGLPRFNYDALEKESDLRSHEVMVGLSYSTVDLYNEKKFSLPLQFEFKYRNRVDGKNNYSRSEYIQFGISIFF